MAFDLRSVLASIRHMEAGGVLQSNDSHGDGYRIDTDGVRGVALLSPKQQGYNLVTRIKDSHPFFSDEAKFWGAQMARMISDASFDFVSHPPSSRKRNAHFATILAQQVAMETGMAYAELFTNAKPRGTRASTIAKLKEIKEYGYGREPSGARILVVDDVMHTRSTAKACLSVCGSDHLFFLILYRA